MELTLSVVLASILFFGLMAIGGALLARGASDMVTVFLLVFALFAGFRPMLFVLGLDGPYPDALFFEGEKASVLTTTLLGFSLYLFLALLGIATVTTSRVKGWGPFFVEREIDVSRALRVTLVLTTLGTLLSLYLVARYGGVGGVIAAAKVEKSLAGAYALRAIPAVGAIVATATFIDARRNSPRPGLMTVLPLVCAFTNAFSVFLWGSRSTLILVAATLVLGLRPPRRRREVERDRVVVRLLLAVVLVVVFASGMRMVRDTLTRGEVQEGYATASVWRQASVGTNSIYFDAAMLSFRDWPAANEIRDGEDFYNGLVGVVPRFLWEGKPTAIPPGKWFRQVYDPRKINGWPMGAPALWYLNFGWLGLMAGGLVSGLAIGTLAAAQRSRARSGYNTAVAIVAGVLVLPLGWDNQVLMKFIIWLVPLWVIGWYVAPRRRVSSDVVPSTSAG